jgi:hypothetical protein
MSEEKATKHNILIRLLSEEAITYDSALFQLAKCLDKETLQDEGILILGYDFGDAEPGTHTEKKERQPSRLVARLNKAAERSPGALGDLYSMLRKYSWRQLYIGGAAAILILILAYKWTIRILTGTFFG